MLVMLNELSLLISMNLILFQLMLISLKSTCHYCYFEECIEQYS